MEDTSLTYQQAYLAMYYFLVDLQERTQSNDLAEFLGSMQINSDDGKPMDPAFWSDWIEAAKKTVQ